MNYFDPDFARGQIEIFKEDVANSRRITWQEWSSRPLAEKLWEQAASLLGSQL